MIPMSNRTQRKVRGKTIGHMYGCPFSSQVKKGFSSLGYILLQVCPMRGVVKKPMRTRVYSKPQILTEVFTIPFVRLSLSWIYPCEEIPSLTCEEIGHPYFCKMVWARGEAL